MVGPRLSLMCAFKDTVLNSLLTTLSKRNLSVNGRLVCSVGRAGAASCCCCCLKAGFTSSLLTKIPTTSLPPRMAEDIVRLQKGSSAAINLDK